MQPDGGASGVAAKKSRAGFIDNENLNANGENIGRSKYINFGWTGMYHEPLTNLYHTHFREYDPVHERWLSEDPAGYADGLNLYGAYMGVDGVDVLGLDERGQPWDWHHIYPQEVFKNDSKTFKKLGVKLAEGLNLDDTDFGYFLFHDDHTKLHGLNPEKYNDWWKNWISNKADDPTWDKIVTREILEDGFKSVDFKAKFGETLKRGFRTNISKAGWDAIKDHAFGRAKHIQSYINKMILENPTAKKVAKILVLESRWIKFEARSGAKILSRLGGRLIKKAGGKAFLLTGVGYLIDAENAYADYQTGGPERVFTNYFGGNDIAEALTPFVEDAQAEFDKWSGNIAINYILNKAKREGLPVDDPNFWESPPHEMKFLRDNPRENISSKLRSRD